MKKWHKVTVTFTGPSTSETATTNPYRNYRLNVTFTAPSGARTVVPGYYAADGNAGESGGTSGSKWRAHLAPNETGTWHYSASFRTGTDVAANTSATAGTATSFDGATGSFTIGASDKKGRDLRAKGLLRYVGKHHLQFAETGEYFIKGGAGGPENLLGYVDFDNTRDTGGRFAQDTNFIHRYAAHVTDWRSGDPTWRSGKGKGIIGALNYLASQGVNSVYFLTYTVDGGDGMDTWMWTAPTTRDRYDASKLDQWEIVFSHADTLGLQLHVVTQETENDGILDSGGLGVVRKIYYRELVARFGHHLAVQWNLGEENDNTDAQRIAFAQYIRGLDPYDHPIAVHTDPGKVYDTYDGLYGSPYFEATSIQGNATYYNGWAYQLRTNSSSAGRKWAVYGDEQMPAMYEDFTNLSSLCNSAMWGNLMGGGAGVDWYLGYQTVFNDLTQEDFSTAEPVWRRTKVALDFFQSYLPFWDMASANSLASSSDGDWVLAKPGSVYAVYLPNGGSADLTVTSGTYQVYWYNPRTGGPLQRGEVTQIVGPGTFSIGESPFGAQDCAEYTVNIPTSGTYYAWGRFYYPGRPGSNDANSFSLQVDNNAALRFGNNKDYFQTWHWDGDGAKESGTPAPLNLGHLTAGQHRIRILKREVDPVAPRLDVMLLSRSTTKPTDTDALRGVTTGTGDGRVWIGCATDPTLALYGGMTYSSVYADGGDLDSAADSLLGALVYVDATVSEPGDDSSAVALVKAGTTSGTDQPPFVTVTGGLTVYEGQSASAPVATATDAKDPASSLRVSVSGVPAGVSVSAANNNGTITASATAGCNVVEGAYNVSLTVMDSASHATTRTFSLEVLPNAPPTLGTYANKSVAAGSTVTSAPSAPPADNAAVASVTVSPRSLGGGGTLSVNASTGVVTVATASGTVAATYTVTVTVADSCGVAVSRSFTLTVTGGSGGDPQTTALYRVRAGSSAYTDSSGNRWSPDTAHVNTGKTYSRSTAIAGTTLDALYCTERYDGSSASPHLTYSFAVTPGTYRLRLHFAEIYAGAAGNGMRVFDVLSEGKTVLDNYDIFAKAGFSTAVIEEFDATTADGTLTVEFRHVKQNPKVNAIEVLGGSGALPADDPVVPAYHIRAGSSAYTDPSGVRWSPDTSYVNTGSLYSRSTAIAGTTLDTLYCTERYDGNSASPNLVYSLPIATPGTYRVRLHFAEVYGGTARTGARVFDVLAEGGLKLDNFDIYAAGGFATAVVREFDLSVTDGTLNIEFRHVKENPKINAIEVQHITR